MRSCVFALLVAALIGALAVGALGSAAHHVDCGARPSHPHCREEGTPSPTAEPTPTTAPTATATIEPTATATTAPTDPPTSTPEPTPEPTPAPTDTATAEATAEATATFEPTPTPEPTAAATPGVLPTDVPCGMTSYLRRVDVATETDLAAALVSAQPGDLIVLADGRYDGRFRMESSGTASDPIVLCGTRNAVIDAGTTSSYAVFLNGVSHWMLTGFTVRQGVMAVALEFSHHNVLRDLDLGFTGQAGVLIRRNSTHNLVDSVWIHDTGHNNPVIGEGVYVGTHYGSSSEPNPDYSTDNTIRASRFGPNVTAEAVDIKQYSNRTRVEGNYFDGTGSVPAVVGAGPNGSNVRAWVDVQGSDNAIVGNTGVNPSGLSGVTHGFFVWGPSSVTDAGRRNVFHDNDAVVNGSGYGFKVGSGNGGADTNLVGCENAVAEAASGFASIACG